MTLVYACVAQNKKIVASAVPPSIEKNVEEQIRMSQECEKVLEQLKPVDNFIVYTSLSQSFFCLNKGAMTYVVVSGSSLSRAQGQSFLNELCSFIDQKYDTKQDLAGIDKAVRPQLQQLMAEFQLQASTENQSKFGDIKTDISQAKDRLAECVELLLQRGEKLSALYTEVDELQEMTVNFNRSSAELERTFCQRTGKYIAWACGLGAVAVAVIVVLCICL